MLPVSWNGSNTIYNRLIRPFVLRHHKEIDEAIDEAVDATRSAVKGGQIGPLVVFTHAGCTVASVCLSVCK